MAAAFSINTKPVAKTVHVSQAPGLSSMLTLGQTILSVYYSL